MRRHLLIGRYGPDDDESVASRPDEVLTELQLVASNKRLDHGIDRATESLKKLNVYPTETAFDLLVLAAHVHAVDTRISRETESQDTWTREIRLVVPVADVGLWSGAVPILQRMLNFLTGDRWELSFRPRPDRFASIAPKKPANEKDAAFDDIGLFSGGLDSLIGAIDTLESKKRTLLISHAGEGATSAAQEKLFEGLQKHYKNNSPSRFRIWMNFPKNLVSGVGAEDTTRGRSFLFFSAGVFAGIGMAKPFTLRVPENGLIALNIPLDSLRLGSLSTRTTHPFYMGQWNALLKSLNIQGVVSNPYWDKTKGEMIKGCANQTLLAQLLPSSLSCSSPTKGRWQGHGIEHCGYCLPCLIRRASVKAGLPSDPTTYTLANLAARTLDTSKAEGQQARSFQYAIERLKRRPGIAALMIHKAGPLGGQSDSERAALAEVYARGLAEVAALLVNVQTTAN